MVKMLHSVALAAMLAAVALPARATDQVLLANGDRLSGQVKGKQGDTLRLETPYAGVIAIQFSEIRRIRLDRPETVVDSGHQTHVVEQIEVENGQARLHHGGQVTALPVTRLAYINPPAHLLGRFTLAGKSQLGLTLTQGNSDTSRYYLDTRFIARRLSRRYTLDASALNTQDQGVTTAEKYTLNGKYDQFISRHRYLTANLGFTQDRFKDLRLRSELGGGLGYQIRDTARLKLAVEGGLNYVREDYFVAADDSFAALRWALDYDQQLDWGGLSVFHHHNGLLGLEDTRDIVVQSRTGIRLPINGRLDATAQVNIDWDNTPAPGARRTDLTWLLNLGYKW